MTDDTEVMVTDPKTGGIKGRKAARFELLPGDALAAVAVHFAKGSRKYEDRNWERGYDWSLSFGAMQRHLWAWWQGEGIDEESGTSHIVSAAWHALALVAFELRGAGTDDRPVTKPKRKRRKDAGVPRNGAAAVVEQATGMTVQQASEFLNGLAVAAYYVTHREVVERATLTETEMARCTYPECKCVDPSTGCELVAPLDLPWGNTPEAQAATTRIITQAGL